MATDNNETVEQTNTNDSGVSERDTSHHDHGDTERSSSVREALKDAFREHGADIPEDKDEDRKAKPDDRRKPWEAKDRPARMAKEATGSYGKDATADANNKGTDAAAQSAALDTSEAPKSWRADEKAAWQNLPLNVKAAIHRREDDVALRRPRSFASSLRGKPDTCTKRPSSLHSRFCSCGGDGGG